MSKGTKIYCVILSLLSLMLIISGCDYQGQLTENQPPVLSIHSFSGRETLTVEDTVAFQQHIHWSAHDPDGIVVGYAYRILAVNPATGRITGAITTPGNEYIDETGEFSTELSKLEDSHFNQPTKGWVLNLKKGVSTNLPFEDVADVDKTIWTDQVSTIVNFPSHDGALRDNNGQAIGGNPSVEPGAFQVVAIDNRGAISNVVTRYFTTFSLRPEATVSTSKGSFNTRAESNNTRFVLAQMGQGIRIRFDIKPSTVGTVSQRPQFFRYRFYQVPYSLYQSSMSDSNFFHLNNPTSFALTIERDKLYIESTDTGWKSTHNLENPTSVILRGEPDVALDIPALTSNFGASGTGTPNTFTVMWVEAVDLAGVVSLPIAVRFLVSDRFRPQARIYRLHSYALSDNFFFPFIETQSIDGAGQPDPVPEQVQGGVRRFASNMTANPIYRVVNNRVVVDDFEWAIHGDRMTRFWIRWGYRGEFHNNDPRLHRETPNLSPFARDNFHKVRDEEDDTDYQSEVDHYLLQLKTGDVADAYPFPPLYREENFFYDADGRWLKVPVGHEISQRIVRNDFLPGIQYTLRVNVVDLQGKRASKPAELKFRLIEPNRPADREGVLYIDAKFDEEDFIVNHYRDIFNSIGQKFSYIHRSTLRNLLAPNDDNEYTLRIARNHLFPVTFLENFRYVIYAAESSSIDEYLQEFFRDIAGFRHYLNNGGNLIVIGTHQLNRGLPGNISGENATFYFDYMGVRAQFPGANPFDQLGAGILNNNYFFTGANAAPGSNLRNLTIDIKNFEEHEEDIFVSRVEEAGNAIFTVTSINANELSANAQKIYGFRSKNPGTGQFDPTQAQYDRFNDSIVAYRFNSPRPGRGTVYVFGFPLLFMDKTQTAEMFREIMR